MKDDEITMNEVLDSPTHAKVRFDHLEEDDPPKLRAYLSAPAHNEIQQVGIGSIMASIEKAGWECVYPDAKGCVATRLDLLKSCDLLITWVDGLLPQGLVIAALTQIQTQLKLDFPPDIQNVIDAGWQALGGAPAASQKKMILLPGEAPSAKDSPKGMTIGFGPGGVTAQMCSPPINLPEGNTLVEAGIAKGLGIPVLAVALGPAAAGDYIMPGVLPMVGSFEALDVAFKTISEAADLAAGLAQILQENIDDLKAMEEAKEDDGEKPLLECATAGEEAQGAAESPLS